MDLHPGGFHFQAVESVLRVAVGEDEILGAGGNRKAHPVSGQEGIGELGGPDLDLINLSRFHKFRLFESVPVAGAEKAVRQLYGAPVLIHIGDPDDKIRIRAVAGDEQAD